MKCQDMLIVMLRIALTSEEQCLNNAHSERRRNGKCEHGTYNTFNGIE